MKKERIFLSTIDPEAQDLARAYGLGLEIAEFCTAWNMDRDFPQTDVLVRQKLAGISRRVLHGPFNELFPCAIDPKARALAAERFHQAAALAQAYGAERMVLHGGFNPWLYYEPYRPKSPGIGGGAVSSGGGPGPSLWGRAHGASRGLQPLALL